jgi:hypothetical protein
MKEISVWAARTKV